MHIECSISCLNLRSERGLFHVKKLVVCVLRIVVCEFETLLSNKSFIADFTSSFFSSQVSLRALKSIILSELRKCNWTFDSFWIFKECGSIAYEKFVPSLFCAFFNYAANDFAKLLNCEETAKKILLKIVKGIKQNLICQQDNIKYK